MIFDLTAATVAVLLFGIYQQRNSMICSIDFLCGAILALYSSIIPPSYYFLISGIMIATIIISGSRFGASRTLLSVMFVGVLVNFIMCLDYEMSLYTIVDSYYTSIMKVIMVAQLLISWHADANMERNNGNYSGRRNDDNHDNWLRKSYFGGI